MDMLLGIAGSAVVFFLVFVLYLSGAILIPRLVKGLFGKAKGDEASA